MTDKIQITTVMRRFTEGVKFYQPSKLETQTLNEKFITSGKILSRESYVASDKMSKTIVTHFASQQALDEFNADPTQMKIIQDRNNWCIENNMRVSLMIQTYNDAGITSSENRVIL
jgi:hypothetical protein